MRTAAFLVFLCVPLAACAGLEDEPAAEPGPPATPLGVTVEEPPEPRWKGQNGRHYRNAYRICSVFTLKELARTYGSKAKVKPTARAHARRLHPPRFFRPAFEGCVHGFRGTPPQA